MSLPHHRTAIGTCIRIGIKISIKELYLQIHIYTVNKYTRKYTLYKNV